MGENPAALRAAVFSLASKNLRGGGVQTPPPPAGRGLIYYVYERLHHVIKVISCLNIYYEILKYFRGKNKYKNEFRCNSATVFIYSGILPVAFLLILFC